MSTNTRYETVGNHAIDEAWAGQTAGFDLYTQGESQFIAYYGADQSIRAGQRELDSDDWTVDTVTEDRNSV